MTPDQQKRIEEIRKDYSIYQGDWPYVKDIQFLLSIIDQLQANQRWIPVGEMLPEIGSAVLVYTPRSEHRKVKALMRLIRYEGSSEFYWDNIYGGGWIHTQEAVTHWRPLLEPPQAIAEADGEEDL